MCIMLFSKLLCCSCQTTVRRQWQGKLHPKSEFTLLETASSLLFQELNSKGLYLSSRKENGSRCLVFPSCIKREKKTPIVGAHWAADCAMQWLLKTVLKYR